jgi:hypothetical protein
MLIGLGIVIAVVAIGVILATRADNERSPADDPDTLLLGVEGNLGSRYRPDEVRRALGAANRGNDLQSIVVGGDSRTGFDVLVRFQLKNRLARAARRAKVRRVMHDVYASIYTSEFANRVRAARIDALSTAAGRQIRPTRLLSTALDGITGRDIEWSRTPPPDLEAAWTVLFRSNDF